ncbi:MAG: sel1 repeat family protein [Neisseriaceae bacterium]|nr:sel1 repeat family protein [Neisseriaceae bacterium]
MKKINFLICVGMSILLFSSCSKFKSTEKQIAECNAGNQEACMKLAEYYSNDVNQATQYYTRACNLNAAEGCTQAGLNYLVVGKNTSQALSLFDKSCSLDGTKKGCYWLGYLASNGFLIPQNYQNAVQYFSKACNVGDSESCLALGDLFRDGKGTDQDYNKALQIYNQACQRSYINACVSAEEMRVILQGNQDKENLYQEALKYELGLGQPENLQKALSLFAESCQQNNAQACMKIAGYYEEGSKISQNMNKAYDFYLKACDLNDYKACTRAGALIVNQGSKSGKNKELASSLLNKSCSANDVEACSLLKQLSTGMVQSTPESNVQNKEQSCNSGNYTSCYELGRDYVRADGVSQDIEKAKQLFNYACNNYVQAACIALQELKPMNQPNTVIPKPDNDDNGSTILGLEESKDKQPSNQGNCNSSNLADCVNSVIGNTHEEPQKPKEKIPSKPKSDKLEDLLF